MIRWNVDALDKGAGTGKSKGKGKKGSDWESWDHGTSNGRYQDEWESWDYGGPTREEERKAKTSMCWNCCKTGQWWRDCNEWWWLRGKGKGRVQGYEHADGWTWKGDEQADGWWKANKWQSSRQWKSANGETAWEARRTKRWNP